MLDFYDNLIGTECARGSTINLDTLGSPSFDLEALELPFSEEEVWNTIKEMPPDKAPGPDRFTGRFYKCWWTIIKYMMKWLQFMLFGRETSETSRS